MTTKLGPPPVEGLSDVAWARVERNVFSRMEGTITNAVSSREMTEKATRSKIVWFAVPLAAAAAFALAFFATKSPQQQPATQPTVATDTPSRVVAGNAPSSITVGDAHLTLDANAALVIDGKDGKQTALIERGSVTFAVPRAFTVLAGDALVRTTNAQFRVSRDGELAIVEVDTGTVQITFRGHEVTVGAHHAWSALTPADVVEANH